MNEPFAGQTTYLRSAYKWPIALLLHADIRCTYARYANKSGDSIIVSILS